MKKILITLLISFPLLSCQAEQAVSSSMQSIKNNVEIMPEKQVVIKDKKLMNEYKGTIHFLNLEGGFYGIITDKGMKLLPMNLAKTYQKAGAIVKVKGEVVDVMTIQQWGTPFKIAEIEIIGVSEGENPTF